MSADKVAEKGMIRVQQVRSAIGSTRKQREVLRTLGLRKLNGVVERIDSPATRGAVKKIEHLVRIIDDVGADAGGES
ncbi:MAG: 50S ribosomal protein L30 [Acidobacteriota bacterium]|nr:50S ribosomal protein L30 [Acidobacteriota bacterium]